MEIVSALVGKVAEYTIAPVGRQVGYLIHYKSNLETLQILLGELSDARFLVEQKVDEAERRGERIMPEVQNWLSKLDWITEEGKDFLRDEHLAKMKCVHGFCPNPMIIYQLSRKSTKFVYEVVELYGKISFNSVSYASYPREEVKLSTTDNEALDSRVSIVNKIMVELRNPNTNRIGVYGLGGVGKTTIVKEVYRQATQDKLFDDVIFILLDEKQNRDLERIQKQIARKLGVDVVEIETVPGRARRICSRIKDKKTLVILDDLWETINLEAVGIPDVATCKILLTARNRKVFSSDEMHTQKDFEVGMLNEEDTWMLFEKIAGDVVHDPAIRNVATQVARNCAGLPVLVVAVASALKNRNTLHPWKDALRILKRYDREGSTEKVYSSLEWSYNQLEDEMLKSLFLLCGITAGEEDISIEDLLRFSIGLGWFRNVSIEEARNTLHSLIERLKDSCLLLDSNKNGLVRMHDLVRDLAISVSFRDHKILSKAYGDELREWPNKDFFERCTMISLPYCRIPHLPEVFECPDAKLFNLWSNDDSLDISFNVFEKMKELKVLSLTKVHMPSILSPNLQLLTALQTLCLVECMLGDIALVGGLSNLEILSFAGSNVKHLPDEIGQLSGLRLLDLNNCTELEVISPNVISSLKRLEELRMENSFNQWEAEGVDIGERSNASISELKHLSQLTALAIHILDADILPAGLFANMLERYRILIGAEWKWYGVDESFDRLLKLKLTTSNQLDHCLEMLLKRSESLYLDSLNYQLDSEDFQQLKHLHVQNSNVDTIINEKVALPNLSSLVVHRCNGLRFMLSSSTSRSLMQLKHLEITECQMMEEVVSTKQYGEEITGNMFPLLQHLKVKGLPNLAWFCSGSVDIEFPSLERLQLKNCANLETFIFHSLTKYIATDGNEIVEGDSKVNTETAVEYFLFGDKVRFPMLKRLSINGLTKLTTIWYHKLFTRGSFSALEDVRVRQCNGLVHMVVLLEESGAGEEIVTNAIKFLFPNVTSVTFENLPQLQSFYLGKHASNWPSLKMLVMNGCDKVEMFATELSCFQHTPELGGLSTPVEQPFFLIEKDGLRNLTSLVFQRCVGLRSLLSSFVARSLENLIHLEISACQVMEEIISEKKHGEEDPNQIFFKLEQLELNDLQSLARFCSQNYIELSSLKTLKVVECAQMNKFIFDPLTKRIAIFKETEGSGSNKTLQTVVQHFIFDVEKIVLPNLTSLIIHRLDGLSFLLSSSMARNVLQFKHREKPECQIMEEIVSATENGEENLDDVFSKLELLELNDVPSLAKFGGYIEFPSIQRLSIMECIKLETVFDPVSKNIAIYKEIEDMHLQENLESVVYSFLFDGKVVLRNITRLIIHRCYGSSSLLSSDMARSLVQLKHVEISECQIMEEIVSLEECSGANIDDMLPNLEQLVLIDLPFLTRFFSESHVEFQSLERLQLEKCTKLETFISYPLRKSIAIDKPNFLFDNKVGFPKLERLTINELPKLTKIWGSQLSQNSFCKLREVTVQQCNSLRNIIADSIIARVFQQLQKLTVENCGVLEEIVAQEATLMPDLPEVTCLKLKSLPQLKRFYDFHPRMHDFNWPLLKTLELSDCGIVDIFDSGFSGLLKTPDSGGLRNQVKQPVVLIEKSSFPKLEDLTLGPMDIWYGPPAPAAFDKHAVFPGISSRHTDLKTLRLHGMEKPMRLWEENTEPTGSVFIRLETLEVKFCGLNNIELSAISFKNLTNLEVTFCWRLQYLTTYPVARSLVHLKKLKVDECKSMKAILANDGDGEDESNCEIDFKQLQHLELSDLISLEWFCSRNCTVKVPLLETSALVVKWCSLKLKISSDKTLEEVDSNMRLNVQKTSNSRKEEPPLNASESEQGVECSQRISKLEAEIRHLQAEIRAKEAALSDKEQKLAEERLATVGPKGT